MNDDSINIDVSEFLVRRYFPFLHKHSIRYSVAQYIVRPIDSFVGSFYVFMLPLLFIISIAYMAFRNSSAQIVYTLQSLLLLILAIAFFCLTCMLFVEAISKKTIQDAHLIKRMLCDRRLLKDNKISRIDFDTTIPILALKKKNAEFTEYQLLGLLPKKVSSSERTIKRLIEDYKINGVSILKPDGSYREWKFKITDNDRFSKVLNRLWGELLDFEIKVLETQKK